MKRTVREDFRVRVVVNARKPKDLGLPIEGDIESGRVELVIAPKRLGDFDFGIMSDSLVTRDPAARYEQRCKDMAIELRQVSHVAAATVEFTERAECTHCGYAWEELTAEDIAKFPELIEDGDVPGLPQCCEQAQDEFRAAKAGAA